MKKIILVLLLFVPIISFCQDFGNYKVENYKIAPDKGSLNNQWYIFKSGGFYKDFNKTPIGIKNAISDIKSILLVNKIKIEEPTLNTTYLSSIVKDLYDYEMLNISISNESSEVYQSWDIDRKQFLILTLKKDSYNIMILILNK